MTGDRDKLLNHLRVEETKIRALIDTGRKDIARKQTEELALRDLLQKQKEALGNLTDNAKVVSLKEYKTLRIAIVENSRYYATVAKYLHDAHKLVGGYEKQLELLVQDIKVLKKDNVLRFPKRGLHVIARQD